MMTAEIPDLMQLIGQQAKAAATELKIASTAAKNQVLLMVAHAMRQECVTLLAANARDMAAATELTTAQRDRLFLDEARIMAMAAALEKVAALPDPVGSTITAWTVPNGLHIARVRVPLGVIGVIYESRPNVTADAAALCLKSGNACILRSGTESLHSAKAIAALFPPALLAANLPPHAVQLIPTADRAAVGALLAMADMVDVIIPRGGKSLIARVQAESRVPVLAHLDGNCHLYIDGAANLAMARAILLNSKMRRTGVCGATETLLVDAACAATHLAPLVQDLLAAGCAVRGDEAVCAIDPRVTIATADDWRTEYLAAIIAVKVVDGVVGAMNHIAEYSSHHTESIVTQDVAVAERFLREVDSAIVLHNASTQFADGGEFGMGAEIGIATGRLHARGPVGLEQLTTYKNVIHGTGQLRPV